MTKNKGNTKNIIIGSIIVICLIAGIIIFVVLKKKDGDNSNSNSKPHKVDCQVGDWVDDGKCSKLCGGGIKKQARHVTKPAANGGKACPPLKKTTSCNTQTCQQLKYNTQYYIWSSTNDEKTNNTTFAGRGGNFCPNMGYHTGNAFNIEDIAHIEQVTIVPWAHQDDLQTTEEIKYGDNIAIKMSAGGWFGSCKNVMQRMQSGQEVKFTKPDDPNSTASIIPDQSLVYISATNAVASLTFRQVFPHDSTVLWTFNRGPKITFKISENKPHPPKPKPKRTCRVKTNLSVKCRNYASLVNLRDYCAKWQQNGLPNCEDCCEWTPGLS